MGIRNLCASFLLAALLLGFSGVPHMSMSQDGSGQMGDCPFAPGTSLCDMSVSQHIAAVQSVYTGLPSDASSFFVVLILLALFSVVAVRVITLLAPTPPPLFAYAIARREDTYAPPHTYLQELFSGGILHTKVY